MTRTELEAKLKEIRDHYVINGEAIGVEIKEIEDLAFTDSPLDESEK